MAPASFGTTVIYAQKTLLSVDEKAAVSIVKRMTGCTTTIGRIQNILFNIILAFHFYLAAAPAQIQFGSRASSSSHHAAP